MLANPDISIKNHKHKRYSSEDEIRTPDLEMTLATTSTATSAEDETKSIWVGGKTS